MMVKMFTLKARFFLFFALISLFCRAQTDVLQQHNDLARTGWDPTETILNTSNVTPTNFGILYRHAVDDQVIAQPLVVTGITVTDPITKAKVVRNLLIVVTVRNTMYAFDADDGTLDPYWQITFTPAGEIPPNAGDVHSDLCDYSYADFKAVYGYGQAASFGTVGTPVIDKATGTVYFLSRYRDMNVDNTPVNTDPQHSTPPGWSSAGFYQQIHALNLSDGTDKFGSPVLIDPTTTVVNGTAPDNIGNVIHFDPRRENQRPGLFISNGILYIGFASNCDMDNYHGWILGYQTNDLTQQVIRYVTTPNDGRGGIWMSGAAPAVDSAGNIFFAVGNGNDSSVNTDPGNMALSVVKATPDLVNHTLQNISWYKPVASTYKAWNLSDLDFGTGVLLIPNSNLLLTAHKSGILFLLPRNVPTPGGYDDSSPNFIKPIYLGVGGNAQCHSSLTYFGGATTKYVYQFSENTHLTAYPVLANSLGNPVQNTSIPVNTIPEGAYSSVSSNGSDPSTAILWVTNLTGTTGGTLHAVKADDVTQELWNSDANPNDVLGNYAKMAPPTIANGKVYVATFTNTVNVYGLLAGSSRCVDNVAANKKVSASATDPTFPKENAVDSNMNSRWSIAGGTANGAYLFVDLGGRYDICKLAVFWDNVNDYAKGFALDITDDTLGVWTTIDSVPVNYFDVNTPPINTFNAHSTARYVRIRITNGGTYGVSISELQIFGSPANNCVSPAVTATPVTNITENSATLNWTPVAGITSYIVKYKLQTISSYITRTVSNASGSTNPMSINITGLACGSSYDYDILSVCAGGVLSTQNLKNFQTSTCSSPCPGLTRWYSADLGDVTTAGKTCYSEPVPGDKTFTLTGYGTGLGGNGDQYQFNYTVLQIDADFIARVASQSTTPVNNQAGIMMRDSLTDISRFMFVGKTGDNRLAFIYRTSAGGAAVSSFVSNATNADFFRIVKVGTMYTAFFGDSLSGPWTQIGAPVDLGFGANPIYEGMAVSGTDPNIASTAEFKNFDGTASPLPVQLMNFAVVNENNKDVKLTWQTAFEENNNYFQILRGTDETHLDSIMTVKSLGNSSITQSYSAIDNNPATGIDYYRLKQVDSDGNFTYSNILQVKFGVLNDPVIYPNPVSTVFTAVPGKDLIREIVIYNVQGKAVQFVMGNSTDSPMKVNVSYLAAGVYILKVKTDSQTYQYKIVKQ